MQERERLVVIGISGLQLVLLLVIYAATSILLRPFLGPAVNILEIVPTYIVGWRRGMWAAITVAVLCGLLDMLTLNPLAGMSTMNVLSHGGALGVTATIGSGAIVGRLHDLSKQLRTELAQRKAIEAELVKARDDMELRVEERTADLRLSEERFRTFLCEVLRIVTDRRLFVCDGPDDLPAPFPLSAPPISLASETLGELRRTLRQVGETTSFPSERLNDLLLSVGEAAMNAVVHGGGGEAIIRWQSPDDHGIIDKLQVTIKDRGTGIPDRDLHRATLEDGYTTANSFGHGFGILLRLVDRVWLLTGQGGTTVVLEQARTTPSLPDEHGQGFLI